MKKLIFVIYSISIICSGESIAPTRSRPLFNATPTIYSPDKEILLEYRDGDGKIYANNQPILTITMQDPEKKNKILQALGLAQGIKKFDKTLFITQILQVILDYGRFGRSNDAGRRIVFGKLRASFLYLFIRQTEYCDLYSVGDCAKRFLGSVRKIATSEEESELYLSLAFGEIEYKAKCAKDDLNKIELPLIAHKDFFKEFNGYWQDANSNNILKSDILPILLLMCPFDQIYNLIQNETNLSNLSLFKNELARRMRVIQGVGKNKYDEFMQNPIISNAIHNSNIQISREEQAYNQSIKRYFIPIMTLLFIIYYILHIKYQILYSINSITIYFICIAVLLVCAQRTSYLNEMIEKIKANLIRHFHYAMYDDVIKNNEDFKHIQKIITQIKEKEAEHESIKLELQFSKARIARHKDTLNNLQSEANRLIELQKIIDELLQDLADEKLEDIKNKFAQQLPIEDCPIFSIIFDKLPGSFADINFESFTQYLNERTKRISDELTGIEKEKQRKEAFIESDNEEIALDTWNLEKLMQELTALKTELNNKDRSNFNICLGYFFLLFNWCRDLIFRFEFANKYEKITILISINLLILMPCLILIALSSLHTLLSCKILAMLCQYKWNTIIIEISIFIYFFIDLLLKVWYMFYIGVLLFVQIGFFINFEISIAISSIVCTLFNRNKLAELFYMPSVLLDFITSILIVANFNNGINQKDIYNTVDGYKKTIKYGFYLFYIFIFTLTLRFICLHNLRFELIPTIIIGKLLFTIMHLLLRTYYDSEQPLQLNSLDSILNLLCIVFNIIYYLYYINLIFILNYMSIFLVILLIDSYCQFSDKLLLQFKTYMEKEFNGVDNMISDR